MASVTKSWVEATCTPCNGRRVFLVLDGWVLVCTTCGGEKRLTQSGILSA